MANKANAKDIAYARDMIKHHEMAVKMSLAVHVSGANDEINEFALNVFTAQRKEIAWLKEWLKKHESDETPGKMGGM